MSMDDDADDDGAGIGPPLPPEDRLWRHPSELTDWGAGSAPTPPPPARGHGGRRPVWPIAILAGLIGAALGGSALAVTGALSPDRAPPAVEKVAVTPIVSTPILTDDGSVAALAEKVGPAVAHLLVTSKTGTTPASGVVIRDDGLLYTSAHGVARATAITVVLADGRRFHGKVVGADLPTDVALVTIDSDHLTVAVLGSSADLAVGDPAVALGWASDGSREPSITTGVVSALEHRLDFGGESLHGLIQTDAPIEPAWSGGPLVDANGAVIGITTGLGGETGFGFATPIDLVRRVAAELLESGEVSRGWLGIECTDLTMAKAAKMGIPGGATVRRVMKGSPAARGGLQVDDVVTSLGGRPVASSSGLVLAMRRLERGDEVLVTYWRDGHRAEATVTIDQHP